MVNHNHLRANKMSLPFVKAGTPLIRSITKKTVMWSLLGCVFLLSCLPHVHANEGRPQVSFSPFTIISPFPFFDALSCMEHARRIIPWFCDYLAYCLFAGHVIICLSIVSFYGKGIGEGFNLFHGICNSIMVGVFRSTRDTFTKYS
jgi:hypothetical protein